MSRVGPASVLLAVAAALSACGDDRVIDVPEPEVRSLEGISIDGFSFTVPVGLELSGSQENCPYDAGECPLADDSVHLVWRGKGVRFDYVLDQFAGTQDRADWGERVTINGRPAYRTRMPSGETRYMITSHFGGADSAAVRIHQEREAPLFWATCSTDESCDLALQLIAGIGMRSAQSECEIVFPPPPPEFIPPPGYRPPGPDNPQPPPPMRPPEPEAEVVPPPTHPHPIIAERCREYLADRAN